MRLLRRLGSYSLVGVFATAVHGFALFLLAGLAFPAALANTAGYLAGFMVSFTLQQRYTFQDKLSGSTLTVLAGVLIFAANLLLSYVMGWLVPGPLRIVLPLTPALVNYVLYDRMSSMRVFRTAAPLPAAPKAWDSRP